MRLKSRAGVQVAATLLAAAACVGPALAADRWGADYFPNVPLITQDGTIVHLYDDLLKGRSIAINVMYTSCVGPGWLFLTGKPEDIKLVTKKLGLSRGSDTANKDGHTASLMVGDVAGGQWMRNSAVDNPQFLATTIGNFLGWRGTKPGKSYAEARPLSVGQGEYLFGSRCSACHTIGQGDKMGPDLGGVTLRRDRAWLARYVAEPDKMLADGDPIATALFEKYKNTRMPNLRLGSADVAAVLSYLEARGKALGESAQSESAAAR